MAGALFIPEHRLPMDFVFGRVAGGRVVKSLAVVDDATHKAVAMVSEHGVSGHQLGRILETELTPVQYAKQIAQDTSH